VDVAFLKNAGEGDIVARIRKKKTLRVGSFLEQRFRSMDKPLSVKVFLPFPFKEVPNLAEPRAN
jgi:hypothetical protein